MDNKLIVPSSDSHWSLRLVDTKKPFPNHILANTTYRIIRFFYPPYALDAVDLTHVVSNPEPNALNLTLFLSFVLLCLLIAGWRYFIKAKTDPPLEKQAGKNRERKDSAGAQLAGIVDLPSTVLMEPRWLSESNEDLVTHKNGDKQDDLAEKLIRTVREGPN